MDGPTVSHKEAQSTTHQPETIFNSTRIVSVIFSTAAVQQGIETKTLPEQAGAVRICCRERKQRGGSNGQRESQQSQKQNHYRLNSSYSLTPASKWKLEASEVTRVYSSNGITLPHVQSYKWNKSLDKMPNPVRPCFGYRKI